MPGRSRVRAVPPLPKSGSLAGSVRESLGHLELRPEDAGIARLAVEYAETMDRAAKLAADLADVPYDPDTAQMVARLRARVEAHAVMADLGPKLQAALDALGATPKSRAQVLKPTSGGTGASKLTQLRGGAS